MVVGLDVIVLIRVTVVLSVRVSGVESGSVVISVVARWMTLVGCLFRKVITLNVVL